MNPAERVVAEAELSGVVGEDDGAAEPILGAERPPQRGFAGHAHGIGVDPQFGQAERADMGRPLGLAGEFEHFCAAERVDDAVRQIGGAHIGRRRRVDRVARLPPSRLRRNARRDLLGPVRKAVNRSEPNCVVKQALPAWRAPVSSTLTKGEARRPALKTASSSARNSSSLAVRSRTTWRFEIERPAAVSTATIRSQVIWP